MSLTLLTLRPVPEFTPSLVVTVGHLIALAADAEARVTAGCCSPRWRSTVLCSVWRQAGFANVDQKAPAIG
ncbi:MAG: hypothetical protein K2X36_00130 [Microbacteriaceae bacterium]|nr:hypothetical protein [Microbacteriaceae bacterium]